MKKGLLLLAKNPQVPGVMQFGVIIMHLSVWHSQPAATLGLHWLCCLQKYLSTQSLKCCDMHVRGTQRSSLLVLPGSAAGPCLGSAGHR
jgi:hypothetical protein